MTEQSKFNLDSVKQLRDELELQAHLFKADAKDEWEKLEGEWQKLEADLTPVAEVSKDALENVGEATSLLFDTVKEGYEKIKSSLH